MANPQAYPSAVEAMIRIDKAHKAEGDAMLAYRRGAGVGQLNAARRELEQALHDHAELVGGFAPGGGYIRRRGQ
jgi:hypothetical protein